MELIKAKIGSQNMFLLNHYPSEIKNGKLEAFVRSAENHKGWQKIKKFSIVDGITLPDVWDKEVTWLDVAKFYDAYGIEVANQYAERKTAGIVSRQTARGFGLIYKAIKHVITPDFDPKFFELLKCDYMLSCFGLYAFDIIALDTKLGQLDADYDGVNSTYKGMPCSMKEYILQKYGQGCVDVIEAANTVLR
jgi:hypothetical protein